ncbi:sulfite exporter TauE/SafE family protein [Halomonas sp. KAO]|uniref:sulfite exporter TauE/SafE family protein n=1 Tax=unclassified Halomonas TaxID=2609666 RepID=UPI0018A02660|nr:MULTISPECIES: sulfite exporter TauE/SafE family protein [unclassified Halomonas]MBF7052886.1 sulfite exporter TauE/SafE family protein [Halomonas sp. KAO]MDT0502733.1 sulfite exporter TauE/SafE family protein [Halomonas sp. PAR7]MDT0513653.1 sulfite exporter TauE/SafE family protein [Halomonas sp. LES1]MDT0593177.1 sulfite exporter TauE/SafE family protein [Halomonas sp. PAR8]
MSIEVLLPFLAIAAVAGYFQTVTGFGLGMIVMGATSGLSITSVASVAAVVSLMTLANSAVALPGKLKLLDLRATVATIAGIIPSIIVGVLLLDYLSHSAASVLRIALGLVVCYGGLGLVLRPRPRETLSSRGSFFISGMLSGLFGGLFGIAGPPVIYQCYRQPMSLMAIRNMLILLFAATSGMRTLFIGVRGELDAEILILAAWAIPVVALATYIGRRCPPPLSALAMRRVAFVTLMLIGGGLIASEVL